MEVGDGAEAQNLTLQQAEAQGYNLLFDNHKLSVQMSLNATGVTHYAVGVNFLVTPPKHRPVFLNPSVISTMSSNELRIQLI